MNVAPSAPAVTSNDGRSVGFTYTNGYLAEISANGQAWKYEYEDGGGPGHRLLRRVERLVFLVAGTEKADVIKRLRKQPDTIVAGRVGQAAEYIEEGRSGLLVPPHDPPALAAAILRLCREPLRRRAMAARLAAGAGKAHPSRPEQAAKEKADREKKEREKKEHEKQALEKQEQEKAQRERAEREKADQLR